MESHLWALVVVASETSSLACVEVAKAWSSLFPEIFSWSSVVEAKRIGESSNEVSDHSEVLAAVASDLDAALQHESALPLVYAKRGSKVVCLGR